MLDSPIRACARRSTPCTHALVDPSSALPRKEKNIANDSRKPSLVAAGGLKAGGALEAGLRPMLVQHALRRRLGRRQLATGRHRAQRLADRRPGHR